jgi:hypothetical protein
MAQQIGALVERTIGRQLEPTEIDALTDFLSLTRWEVGTQAQRTRVRSPVGSTWLGLYNLMERQGYGVVEELGLGPAISWARHLQVIGDGEPAA